jgi:Flp pilus assembly pilin Flp
VKILIQPWRENISRFAQDEQGTTTAEYGLVMAFIVLAALGSITLLGLAIDGWFAELTGHFVFVMG